MNIGDLNFLIGQSLTHQVSGEVGFIKGFYLVSWYDQFEMRVQLINDDNYFWIEKYDYFSIKHDNGKSFLRQLAARNADGILNSKLFKLLN